MVTSFVTEKGVGRGESQPRHPKLLKKREICYSQRHYGLLVAFLKYAYAQATNNEKFLSFLRSASVKYTWSIMVTLSFCDLSLITEFMATERAEFQNNISLMTTP